MKVAIILSLVLFCIVKSAAAQNCVNPGCKACGNGVCEIGETPCTCPQDCRGCCADGSCRRDRGETALNCPEDCAFNLTVRVIEAQSGLVLPGAVVSCYMNTIFHGPAVTSAADTIFPQLPEGSWTCKAEKAGYFPNSVTNFLSHAAKCVDVPVIIVPLTYDASCIHGKVLNAQNGDLISGAKVSCTGPAGNSLADVVSDASGNWFREIREGNWTCTASAAGFRSVTTSKFFLAGECGAWRFHLPPLPGTVTGRFRDSKNLTSLTAAVTCTDADGNQYTATGANFTFLNVSPGAVTCTASKFFFYDSSQTQNLPSNGLVIFEFLLVEYYGNLEGTVIDGRTGLPIPNVDVDCMSCYDSGMILTNQAGYYFLGGLKQGPFMCMATHKGYMDGWLNQVVDVNQTNQLNFVLLPIETVIYGKVHAYDLVPGAPVANAAISCWTNDYRGNRYQVTARANATGDYRVGEIYGFGELTCIFKADGYAPSSRSIKYSWREQIACNIPMVKL